MGFNSAFKGLKRAAIPSNFQKSKELKTKFAANIYDCFKEGNLFLGVGRTFEIETLENVCI